ncbi:unnamed protein product [Calypogeia fissa]
MSCIVQIRSIDFYRARKRQYVVQPGSECVEDLTRDVGRSSSPPTIPDAPSKAYTTSTPVWLALKNGRLLLSCIHGRKALLLVSLLLILLFHSRLCSDCYGINLFWNNGGTKHFRSGGSLSVSFAGVMSVMNKLERNNTVIVTMANPAYYLFLENWDCFAKPFIGRRFLVYTTDYDFGQRISEKDGYHVLVQSSELNEALNFGTTEYQQLILARTQVAGHLLEAGKSVLIVDNDSVWLSDPLPYLDAANADIVTSRDGEYEMDDAICGGLLHLKHTPTTKRVWSEVTRRHLDIIEKALANNHLASFGESEQTVINEIFQAEQNVSAVREKGMEPLRVHFLDPLRFPNGLVYFEYGRPQEENVKPVVIHNNWIVGYLAKLKRFEEFGLWAVSSLVNKDGDHRCTFGS